MPLEERKQLNLEALLRDIGEFGYYQQGICFMLCALISLSGSMSFSFTFTNAVPPTRCFVPTCDSVSHPNYEDAASKGFGSFAYPPGHQICHVYNHSSSNRTCDPASFQSQETLNCSKWIYDKELYGNNFISDFDLVCNSDTKGPLLLSAFFAGQMIGLLPIGALSDQFGRKVIFLFSSFSLALIGTVQGLFAYNYRCLLVSSFLVGIFQSGFFQLGYILSIEIVGKSKRVLCGSAIQVCFVLGELYLALIAWHFRDWRKIILGFSMPCFISLLYVKWIPESPRWLLAKGKKSEIEKLAQRIAKINQAPIPNIEDYYEEQNLINREPNEGLIQFIGSRILCLRIVILSFGWFVVGMSYYGLSLNASKLSGSVYLNFSLLSLVEVPGYILSFILMKLSGRRLTMVGSLILSGLFIIISNFARPISWLATLLYLLSKMSITCAFATIYMYTSELLPTSLRTGCVSVVSLVGKVGSLVSPYISLLSFILGPKADIIVLGLLPLIIGIAFLCLPETLGKGLPNTIRDAEQLSGISAYIDDTLSNISESEPLIEND